MPRKSRRSSAKRTNKKIATQERLKTMLWFLVKLNIIAIPLYVILLLNITFLPFQELIALISGNVLTLVGYNTVVSGNVMVIATHYGLAGAMISWDSTGWKSLYFIAALAIASPKVLLSARLRFLAMALPLIFAINIVRIVTTLLIAFNFGAEYFNLVHEILWSAGMIVAVLTVWVLWLRRQKIIFTKT